MARTVTATQARVGFGGLMQEVVDRDEPVVVERGGQPMVVVLSFQRYQRMAEGRPDNHWRAVLDRAADLRERIGARAGARPLPRPEDLLLLDREERDAG